MTVILIFDSDQNIKLHSCNVVVGVGLQVMLAVLDNSYVLVLI